MKITKKAEPQTGKLKDLLAATKDEAVDTVVESGVLQEIVEGISDTFVSEGTALLLSGMIGAISPRINGIRLSYKQNRFERHVLAALGVMASRIDLLEANFTCLDPEVQGKFRGQYLEWLLDNLADEKQQEKIPYHVNGFINLMSNEANDNLMVMFFQTLNELTTLDIDVLLMYSRNAQENIYSLCDRYNLQFEQVEVIKEKLTRLGLLRSKNDAQRDANLDSVVAYLTKFDKDIRSKAPKGVKLPSLKKIQRSESYSITSLGNSYLLLISEGN